MPSIEPGQTAIHDVRRFLRNFVGPDRFNPAETLNTSGVALRSLGFSSISGGPPMMHTILETLQRPFVPWLALLGLGLFISADFALRMRRQTKPGAAGQIAKFLAALLLAALAVDGVELIGDRYSAPVRAAAKLAVIGCAMAGAWLCARAVSHANEPTRLSKRLALAALILAVCTTGWSGYRFRQNAFPPMENQDTARQPPEWEQQSESFAAYTDKGRQFPLFQMSGVVDELADPSIASLSRAEFHGETAILRQARNARSNCHGWVFGGNRFIVHGDSVEMILSDNAYQKVKEARAGDVVIYRDGRGVIVHSGLVRGVLDDGTVMVESKWGTDHRYLHSAAEQPYSQLYAFHRSERPGHRVTINPLPPPSLRLAPEDRKAIEAMLMGKNN